jgi:hypothetical protein
MNDRRRNVDRRANSPKLKEWINGLSIVGKVTLAVAGVLGGSVSAVGAKTVLVDAPAPPDVTALTHRIEALERNTAAFGAILASAARYQCLHSTEQEVVYAQMPCDSLMRGIGGWRVVRAETLRTSPLRVP